MDYTQKVKEFIEENFHEIPLANVMTFGCVQNENDSEKIRGVLFEMGYGMTDLLEKSDIVIFNTCAIRENAELKIFGNIGKLKALKQANKNMIIAVCGCMVMQEHIVEKIKKSYPFVDIIFGVNGIEGIPQLIYNCLTQNKKQILYPDENIEIIENTPIFRSSKSKASISIMFGCDNFCSYCIVPYVRGRERSRNPQDILSEFTSLINEGYKDITLVGQNVNSYGKNLNEKIDFADLLQLLCRVKGDYVLHFMSSHPKDINHKVIDTIRDNKQISRQIHLPVQAGSNRILQLMNRKYTVEEYLEIIKYAKEQIPQVEFSSDIIVGFPGESFDEYLQTENLVKQVRFTQLFTFIYSKRTGTKAALLPDDVPHSEKALWLNRLVKVQQEIFFEYLDSFIGKTVRALAEEKYGETSTARMANTLLVKFESETDYTDEFVTLRITGKKGTTLTGELFNK
ncbi:MAG: tRNA (N6-isopentenyl adenosine(37)-C2)-methylthiotransferase MiaB [Oscillospiraceae bacterium]